MSELEIKDRIDYAWKHFSLIADQRIKTFNFYILVVAASLGATFTLAKPNSPRVSLALLGFAHLFVAGLFYIIDSRGCAMLKLAREGLKSIEFECKFPLRERFVQIDGDLNKRGLLRLVSYRFAFRAAFFVHGAFGLMLAVAPSVVIHRSNNDGGLKMQKFEASHLELVSVSILHSLR